jgi:hypothetical protein
LDEEAAETGKTFWAGLCVESTIDDSEGVVDARETAEPVESVA